MQRTATVRCARRNARHVVTNRMAAPAVPARLTRSQYLRFFAHQGAVYLFHDLYGFIMEMSPDIVALIDAFATGADTQAICRRFAGTFGDADPAQFIDVLAAHYVLVELDAGEDERDGIWPMCPIVGKWNVWHRSDKQVTLWTAWGERPVAQVVLTETETQIWDAINGEIRLNELRQRFGATAVRDCVLRLVHHEVQALKLSLLPQSTYAKRPNAAPAYLASTMPYAPWQPGQPVPGARTGAINTEAYYRTDIVDSDAQFDHQETTLSHLLRVPHPALRGQTYGQVVATRAQSIAAGLPARAPMRVLEIGAGLGYVGRDLRQALQAHGYTVEYTIVEISPALAAAQRRTFGAQAAEVTWVETDVLAATFARESFDLVLANEMIGDLPALEVTRAALGLPPEAPLETSAVLAALGPAAEFAVQAHLPVADAPEPFYLTTGAFDLVRRIGEWLAPGGQAFITEFGDLAQWPRLSTQLDHPELSIHFGQLAHMARFVGLNARVEFVIDWLDIDREQKGLATTRSQYRALTALAAAHRLALPKIGYTPALWAEATAAAWPEGTVGDLRWQRIEDRLMGLVPHEFKVLIAHKKQLSN